MNRNSEAITLLCSHLCVSEGIVPLEPKEWSDLAERLMVLRLQPGDLLGLDGEGLMKTLACPEEEAARLQRLMDRCGSIRFELAGYEDMGIGVVTRGDEAYPRQLKKKLGNSCPPLFYYAGDLALLQKQAVGYVGSRDVEPNDIAFTRRMVAATTARGYAVVSGGAKGIDSIATAAGLSEGGTAVEFLSDSMLRKLRDAAFVREIRDGHVLLMSVVVPKAGFNVGVAMMRNRYIYAQSEGTVVIRSDKGKGGTWAGATENLKKHWCPTFCRDREIPGNRELIRLGAIPISDDWDGDVRAGGTVTAASAVQKESVPEPQQLSLFDL